jgi:hypothetical protein
VGVVGQPIFTLIWTWAISRWLILTTRTIKNCRRTRYRCRCEPETQALNSFLLSVGRANVSIHYHDSLNYVVGSSQDGVPLATQYASAGGFRNFTDEGRTLVPQRGSIDGWYNQETGTPTILVEMGPVAYTQDYISKHVAGVLAVINGGAL